MVCSFPRVRCGWLLKEPVVVDKSWSDHLLAGLLRLLGQQNSLDVGQNTTLSDRDARQQLVQFLVVADGQLKVTWNDASLLVVKKSQIRDPRILLYYRFIRTYISMSDMQVGRAKQHHVTQLLRCSSIQIQADF